MIMSLEGMEALVKGASTTTLRRILPLLSMEFDNFENGKITLVELELAKREIKKLRGEKHYNRLMLYQRRAYA